MTGQTLLVLSVLCLANVGLSQPIESAKDPAATPAPVTSKPNEVPTTAGTAPEEAAGEGAAGEGAAGEGAAGEGAASQGHIPPESGIDEAIKLMNTLNDLFQTIVDSIGHGEAKESPDGGEAKGEETTAKAGGDSTPAPAAGNTTPAPAAGHTTPAPAAANTTPAPDAGKPGTTVKAAAKKQ